MPETVPEAQHQATGSVSFSGVEETQNAWQPADEEAWQLDAGSSEGGDRAPQDKGAPGDDADDQGVKELCCAQCLVGSVTSLAHV